MKNRYGQADGLADVRSVSVGTNTPRIAELKVTHCQVKATFKK